MSLQPPEPVDSWEGVFQATDLGPECPTMNAISGIEGTEDCLRINVYTPQVKDLGKFVR